MKQRLETRLERLETEKETGGVIFALQVSEGVDDFLDKDTDTHYTRAQLLEKESEGKNIVFFVYRDTKERGEQ